MNENRPEDEPNLGPGGETRSGLSVSREDSESRSAPPRSRRSAPGGADKLWQAAQADESIVAHWFLPVAGLVLVLLIATITLYFSHGGQLNTLNRQVAALAEQNVGATSGPDVDRILARMDELSNRLGAIKELDAEVKALRDQLVEQNKRIEALAGRVEAIEKEPVATRTGSSGSGESDAQSAPAEGQAGDQAEGGEWVVNLITLGDVDAARSFQERLDKLGIESRIEAITSGDKTLQRVVVPGFSSLEAAQQVVPELKQRLELSDDPWITRQSG